MRIPPYPTASPPSTPSCESPTAPRHAWSGSFGLATFGARVIFTAMNVFSCLVDSQGTIDIATSEHLDTTRNHDLICAMVSCRNMQESPFRVVTGPSVRTSKIPWPLASQTPQQQFATHTHTFHTHTHTPARAHAQIFTGWPFERCLEKMHSVLSGTFLISTQD